MVGRLSLEVVSGGDVGIPVMPAGEAAILPQNFADFGRDLDVDADQLALYLAARELAHARLFRHARWLRLHVISQVTDFARGLHVDTDALEELASRFDPSEPEELRKALESGALIPQRSDAQTAALTRLEPARDEIEGWVDVVAADATTRLPSADKIGEAVRRRRAVGGPAEQAMGSLVGLELRPRRLREAAAMWRAVTNAAVGTAARDSLWDYPDLMPTASDIDDPAGLIDRLQARARGEAPARDEMDDALEALLNEAAAEDAGETGPAERGRRADPRTTATPTGPTTRDPSDPAAPRAGRARGLLHSPAMRPESAAPCGQPHCVSVARRTIGGCCAFAPSIRRCGGPPRASSSARRRRPARRRTVAGAGARRAGRRHPRRDAGPLAPRAHGASAGGCRGLPHPHRRRSRRPERDADRACGWSFRRPRRHQGHRGGRRCAALIGAGVEVESVTAWTDDSTRLPVVAVAHRLLDPRRAARFVARDTPHVPLELCGDRVGGSPRGARRHRVPVVSARPPARRRSVLAARGGAAARPLGGVGRARAPHGGCRPRRARLLQAGPAEGDQIGVGQRAERAPDLARASTSRRVPVPISRRNRDG